MAKKKMEMKQIEPLAKVQEPELTTLQNTVSDNSQEVEKFKVQLVQSLELTDKLVRELETKEKEVTVFKEVKLGLERVIESQNNEIEKLKNDIKVLKVEKFQERIDSLAKKWVKKYNLSDDKIGEVTQMLSKFQNESELAHVEELLGLANQRELVTPVPLTTSSTNLAVETFKTQSNVKDYEKMSLDEKRAYLWSKIEAIKNKQ